MHTKTYLLLGLAGLSPAHADVKLPAFFSDHMVLQRDIAAPVWGTAAPGEKVAVSFAGQTATATAGADGRWLAKLAPLKVSATPEVLTVRGANTVAIQDVVVGDVWLASGQSNMDSPLSSGSSAEALATANDPLLRFFKVAKTVAAEPQTDVKGKWDPSTPEAAKNFSAVAYFFAREIRRTQNVPVGVFNDAWGGTPIRTWMAVESLRTDSLLSKTLAEWQSALARHHAVKDQPELMAAYYKDMKDWETTVEPAYKAARKSHDAEAAAARAAGRPAPASPKPARPEPSVPDPIAMPSSSKRPSTPTVAYNAMIAPIAPYGLRGFIWYQGEADASHGLEYRAHFPALIEGWRAAWKQGDLPFLWVQLPSNGKDAVPVASQGIPFLREAQALALRLPATGMAVTLDIGDPDNVHPDNKVHTGGRLSLVARQKVYGEKIVGSGPLYRDHTIAGSTIRVRFSDIGGGLVVGTAPWRPAGSTPWPADKLLGFYVAGADQQWVEATARIDGDAVVVSSPVVSAPVAVRYGWAASPRVNLYNREGLAASPFRTDDGNR